MSETVSSNTKPVDVIIPLSTGSRSNNDELRICFRSIAKHALDIGKIILVTTEPPAWLSDAVNVLAIPDTGAHNKDANIINKVISALKHYNIVDDFVFFSDDQCLLKDINLRELPPVYNNRSKDIFVNAKKANNWTRRVVNTFNFLEKQGIYLPHNYESHTPQRYNAEKLLATIEGIDYKKLPGFTINTLFMGMLGVTGGVRQSEVKVTYEDERQYTTLTTDLPFCGYNDKGFLSGLRDILFDKFNQPSIYEQPLQVS